MALIKPSFVATDPVAPLSPSPSIWGSCPVESLMLDPSVGTYIFERWDRVQQRATMVTTQNSNGYYPLLDTGSTITGSTATTPTTKATWGVRDYMILSGDGTDNDQTSMMYSGMTDTPTGLAVLDTGYGKMWYETVVTVTSVVTNAYPNILVGLRDITATANEDMSDAGTDIADIDYVGYAVWQDDGDALDAIYQTTGSAFATVKATAGTLVASTWVRLGITFDDPTVTYWVDGANVGTVDINTSGFPDGEALTPFWLAKVGTSGTATTMNVGWWRFAQLFNK